MVGKDEATIRRWVKQFNIPYQEAGGKKTLSAEMMQALSQIKALRNEGMSTEDIRLNIGQTLKRETKSLPAAKLQTAEAADLARLMGAEISEQLQEHSQAMAEAVKSAVDQVAKMGQELGATRTRLEFTLQALSEAQQQARQLPEKAQSLLEAEQRAQQLEQQIIQTKARSQELDLSRQDLQQKFQKAEIQITNLEEKNQDLKAQTQAQASQIRELQQLLEQERQQLAVEQGKSWWAKLNKR